MAHNYLSFSKTPFQFFFLFKIDKYMLSVEQSITKTEQMMNDLIDIKET